MLQRAEQLLGQWVVRSFEWGGVARGRILRLTCCSFGSSDAFLSLERTPRRARPPLGYRGETNVRVFPSRRNFGMPRKGQTEVHRERWNEPFSGMSRYFIARARFGIRVSVFHRSIAS